MRNVDVGLGKAGLFTQRRGSVIGRIPIHVRPLYISNVINSGSLGMVVEKFGDGAVTLLDLGWKSGYV